MPLLDHFHAPLKGSRHWEGFHAGWAYEMARAFNRRTRGQRYFAEPQVTVTGGIEIDVANFESAEGENGETSTSGNGAVAVAAPAWAPPKTALVMATTLPDDIEVQIYKEEGGARLVAAIELVSPGNKDRPESRRDFVAKCSAYLQRGIGLVIVDVVTDRHANLHNELVRFLGQADSLEMSPEAPIYVVSYRTQANRGVSQTEIWPYALAVGQGLPVVPLSLRDGPTLPLELESTYTEARTGLGL
ncbi:MAG: DUF4058 family protein [Gemmataceae bacterium]